MLLTMAVQAQAIFKNNFFVLIIEICYKFRIILVGLNVSVFQRSTSLTPQLPLPTTCWCMDALFLFKPQEPLGRLLSSLLL